MAIVEPTYSWGEHARLYTSIYRNGLSQDFIDAYRVYAGGLCDISQDPPAPLERATPPSDVDISSIGKLSKYVGESYGTPDFGIEVLDIGVGIDPLNRQAVIYIWTFREQLTLSIAYNLAFHTKEQMEAFVEDMENNVLGNLGD
jgi:hypothetical protein